MNKKSVRANAGDNGRQSKTKNNIPVNKESSTDDAAPTDDNKNNSNTSSSVSDTPKNIPGAESQTKNTPSPEDNKTSNDKTEDVKNTFQEKFDNLHKEIETITSKLNGIVPEIKGLAPKINGTINSTGESRGGEYRSLQNSLSELEKKLETNTSYTFSTKYMLEELMNKLDKMKRLQDDNDNLPK